MVRALGSVASAFFLSALCASCRYPVEIRTEPPGAEVVVEALGPSGQPQVELPGTQITPAKYDLDFDAFSEYQATVSKSDYMDEKVKLTKAMLRALPRDPDGTYVATVKLKQYREVKTPQVVVDPREGLKVLVREVRAFPEDIEREGAAASKIVSLGEGLSVTGIALSPDGKHIAFSALETLKDSGSNQVQMLATLRAVASEGGGIAQLTTGSWLDVDPSFDRTGRMVYFVSNRLRSDGLDVFGINFPQSGGILTIYQQNEGWARQPREAKGGLLTFAFQQSRFGRAGMPHIWTIGGPNGFPTQLKEGTTPAPSPDGGRIAFIGHDNKLWVLDLGTQRCTQLTSGQQTVESQPVWSPDGAYIVYVSNAGKDSTGEPNNDLWLRRADGSGAPIQLTTNGSDDNSAAVDPSGKWIYFVSNRGFTWGIWRIPWPSDQLGTKEPVDSGALR